MDFPEKVQRTIEKYRMIAPGDSIVIKNDATVAGKLKVISQK